MKGTPMEKIRIITDSGSDIIAPYPQNLTVIPLTIHFGPEEYLDGVTIDHKTFYEKLVAGKDLPTTSLIPPGEFEQAFDRAEQAGETVIAIILSSKLSGTYQSAVLAAEGRDNVYVVDSLNATLGEQILVKYALELVERGMSASGIASELERAKAHATVMGVVDTLEYLHRGGRISKTVAVLGGALSIKPVLRVTDGEVAMIGKARGSKTSNNFLIQETSKCGVNYEMPICLGYTGLSDELLQRYIADSRQLWEGKVKELPISTVGATIGTHVGPGAVVVAFFDTQE